MFADTSCGEPQPDVVNTSIEKTHDDESPKEPPLPDITNTSENTSNIIASDVPGGNNLCPQSNDECSGSQTEPTEENISPGLPGESLEETAQAICGTGATQKPAHHESSPFAELDKAPLQSVYHVKWIKFKNKPHAIITQNENGPCPLLAIMNVLLLQGKVKLPAMMEMVTSGQLMEYLGDCIFENAPKVCSCFLHYLFFYNILMLE